MTPDLIKEANDILRTPLDQMTGSMFDRLEEIQFMIQEVFLKLDNQIDCRLADREN